MWSISISSKLNELNKQITTLSWSNDGCVRLGLTSTWWSLEPSFESTYKSILNWEQLARQWTCTRRWYQNYVTSLTRMNWTAAKLLLGLVQKAHYLTSPCNGHHKSKIYGLNFNDKTLECAMFSFPLELGKWLHIESIPYMTNPTKQVNELRSGAPSVSAQSDLHT